MFESDSDAERLNAHLRITRIIVGTMIMGTMIFLAIAIMLGRQHEPNPDARSLISYMALALLPVMLLVWWINPDLIANKLMAQIAAGTWKPPTRADMGVHLPASAYATDASKLLAVNQTRAIIATATLQGAAAFGCVAYIVEGRPFALAAPVVTLAVLALTFPTRHRVVQWAEAQQMRINDMRSEGTIR